MNLLKQATRVNRETTLGSFCNTTGDKEHKKYRVGALLMPKADDVVPPPQMSVWERPVYQPDNSHYVRPGANDFLKIKSKGF